MKRRFQVGDRVTFRWYGGGNMFGERWEGVVSDATDDRKLVQIKFGWDEAWNPTHRHTDRVWRRAWRVRLIAEAPRPEPQRPAVVDARVLEELTAIQHSLGSTEALLDMLRDIRKSYGPEAEEKGGAS